MTKLSEQIANTCCGVLADKSEMIEKAIAIENRIEALEKEIEALYCELMGVDDEK